jgi:sugar/nucleoside kinase (ribokinase family)
MTADSHPPALVVLGELNADIVIELDGPPVFGQSERVVPSTQIVMGGSSAITACGAALMGIPTSLVSVIGDDMLGRFLLDLLQTRGVDVSSCRTDSPLATGTSTILCLPDGDRSILTAMGSIGTVTIADIPQALLAATAHVHVGSYFLQHGLHRDLPTFFSTCRARGLSTSLDPNDDPRGEWTSGIGDVLPHVDVFFCNEVEAMRISRTTDLNSAVNWFMARMALGSELVVKLGADGAIVVVVGEAVPATRHEARPQALAVPLVDTVGAGDSLAAGYLAARLRGLSIQDRLRVGVRNGTASTRGRGGMAAQLSWGELTAS